MYTNMVPVALQRVVVDLATGQQSCCGQTQLGHGYEAGSQ
jgi:hypothetical protein